MRWQAVCCLLAVCLFSTLARAESELYWVNLDAPGGCPSLSRMHQLVADRDDRLRLDEHGARFLVLISEDDGSYEARLQMPDGAARRIRAAQCDDLIEAVAFIIAVQVDAASSEARPEEKRQPGVGSSLLAPGSRWHAYAGATAGVVGGRTPELMPGGGIFFEAWREGATWGVGAQGSVVFGANDFGTAPGTLRARFLGSVLDVCPFGVSVIAICTGLEVGAQRFSGDDLLSNDQTLRWSLAGRVGGQLRYVWKAWVGELSGGAWLPMTVDELVIQRADGSLRSAHRVRPSGYAGLSIGYRL